MLVMFFFESLEVSLTPKSYHFNYTFYELLRYAKDALSISRLDYHNIIDFVLIDFKNNKIKVITR